VAQVRVRFGTLTWGPPYRDSFPKQVTSASNQKNVFCGGEARLDPSAHPKVRYTPTPLESLESEI
jgi:hypothetical protein